VSRKIAISPLKINIQKNPPPTELHIFGMFSGLVVVVSYIFSCIFFKVVRDFPSAGDGGTEPDCF
jgi:hypothetical protein